MPNDTGTIETGIGPGALFGVIKIEMGQGQIETRLYIECLRISILTRNG
ncbi:hypothetical protein H6F78_16490 [Coleofasciculus sp. FACHB-64]|nr:hypothetical protein [Coleofasciculus sp. FACHB-64]